MHSNNGDLFSHNEFLISNERLAELVENINHQDPQLQQYCGGMETIVSALKTDLNTGIVGDQTDLLSRRKQFGSNSSLQELPPHQKPTKSLKQFLLEAVRDTTIILLLCCAMVSLAIGIKRNGVEEGLSEGAMAFLAISLVVTFGAIFCFLKAKWILIFKKPLKQLKYWVVRSGKIQKIPETGVVVGDILWLQTGDHVPADGILIGGDSYHHLIINDGLEKKHGSDSSSSVFSGANVVQGQARMLVTSVGVNTERSRLIGSIGKKEAKLRFLDAIDITNSKLEKIWLSLTLLLLTAQLVRCFVLKPDDQDRNRDPKGVKNTTEDLMNESIKLMKKERSNPNRLVTMLCILVFATRDGLPLAVFTTLLYASHKMKFSCGAMIQKLPASAMIGSVTTICTGKTTDLVLQHKRMAELWVGFELVIDDVHRQVVDNEILDLLREGIFLHGSGHGGREDISLLCWAKAVLGFNNYLESHQDDDYCSIAVRYEAGDDHQMDRSDLSCLVTKRESSIIGADDKVLHVHWKGDPKLIVLMCSQYYKANGTVETLDDNTRKAFLSKIESLVACGLCCFAFAWKREIIIKGEEKSRSDDQEQAFRDQETQTLKTIEQDLILLGLVVLKNPYTPEVREAIEEIRKSQVGIKLMVDDDINTARIMALNCGLLRPREVDNDNNIEGGAIIEAARFRSSSEEEHMNMIDSIQVMANSTPADKLLMVQCLRRKGEIVAATASCIRDTPLLKEADVGIFMGDSKEDHGHIQLVLSNSLSQIHGIVKLGRCVCESLKKFLVLHLTLEISAFAINFINALAVEELISSFQILWINLIMELVGALAVAITTIRTDSSSEIDQCGKLKPVITRTMYRSIALYSLFQVTVILILGMKGKDFFRVDEGVLKTMIFNCYAFCQVFLLLLTAIELTKKNSIAQSVSKRSCLMFLGIVAVIGILQVPLVEIMAVLAGWATLDIKQWCICIGIASFSVLLGCAANWIYISIT